MPVAELVPFSSANSSSRSTYALPRTTSRPVISCCGPCWSLQLGDGVPMCASTRPRRLRSHLRRPRSHLRRPVIASVLRTSIRAPFPFHTGECTSESVSTDPLIAPAHMERKFIGELVLLRLLFELKGASMAARGDPWEAKCAFSKVARNVGKYPTTRGGALPDD